MASDSMCMENLEEFILDENRIVTYKWLSQSLSVHVNQAKQMLYTFVDDQRNNKHNDDLSVVYFVAGAKKLENGDVVHQCCVLPEEKMETFKSILQSVTSCHVYSVHKSRLKDSNALYMSDYEKRPEDVTDYNKHGVIKCAGAVVRSEDELKKLRGLKITEAPQNNIQKTTNKTSNGHSHGDSTKSKPTQKPGIAGMFAGAGKSTTVKKETKSSVVKSTENNDKEKASTTSASKGKSLGGSGGVQSFFSKQTASKVKAEETTEEQSREKQTKEKHIKEKSPVPEKRASKGKGKKSRPQDSDDEPQSKKRRRIRNAVVESSSEEEDVDMEPESPVPSPPREMTPPREDTPPPETKPPATLVADTPSPNNNNNTSTKKSTEKRRKRTRKLVPKTFMDEDGYMVTEKVWESDSTDASEVEEPETKKRTTTAKDKYTVPTKKKAVPQKKPSPVKGNKQASLMSFFKKK